MLLSELGSGERLDHESWMSVSNRADAGIETLFAGICESTFVAEADLVMREADPVIRGSERFREDELEATDGNEGERSERDGGSGPTQDQLLEWQGKVTRQVNGRAGKDFSGDRFQCRCFAVEWRSSVLVDGESFLWELFRLIGGDVPFVLGGQVRKSRADYSLIVRGKEVIRWREWTKKLMFGHGGEADGVFIGVEVPLRNSEECTRQFVLEMTSKCERYDHVWRYKEDEMKRELHRGYSRPGRRKTPVEKQ